VLSQEAFKDYCDRFRVAWNIIRVASYNTDLVIDSLCTERGYDRKRMESILLKTEVCFVDPEKFNFSVLSTLDKGDLGLKTSTGQFLLSGRYIVPVKDMLGNVIALIGWNGNSERKYVTTPSKLFSKECLFYGMEQFKDGLGKPFVVVEGIFDCISVRSLDLRCVAMMGITPSRYKCELYSLMGRILAVPDNDKEGRKVISEDSWSLPSRGKYLRWSGAKGIKDIDDLVKSFDASDVKSLLVDAMKENDRIVNINLI
jgi:DNA primase